ncbi:MAG TPA: hypothetical protein VGB13_11150 [Candidatus Krumholzibacteria bacterium]
MLRSTLGGCGGGAPRYSLSATHFFVSASVADGLGCSCLKPRVVSLALHLDDTDFFVNAP